MKSVMSNVNPRMIMVRQILKHYWIWAFQWSTYSCCRIWDMPRSVFHHSVKCSELRYYQRRLSSTNKVLLYTVHPRRCLFTPMYNQSFLFPLALQFTTMHRKVVNDIAFSFSSGDGISLKLVNITLYRLTSIHTPRVHRCGNALKRESTAEQTSWTDAIPIKAIYRCRQNGNDQKKCYLLYRFCYFTDFGNYSHFQEATFRGKRAYYGGLGFALNVCAH